MFLLETLDVKFSGLVDQLYSDQVVSAAEKEDIVAEKTSFRANEKLLSVLSRKSLQQFQLFLDALDNCGQQHVRIVIDDRRGLSTLFIHLFTLYTVPSFHLYLHPYPPSLLHSPSLFSFLSRHHFPFPFYSLVLPSPLHVSPAHLLTGPPNGPVLFLSLIHI